ncbi:phosphoribosylanthranilate isomerase [Mucilaginibacter sp. AW1-3]
MKIKVCGMTDMNNVKQLKELNPDYIGFIFYPKSPRFVKNENALNAVPKNIIKTGVFVDLYEGRVEEMIHRYHLDAIQLHGNESPGFCAHFKGSVQVLKAFGVDENFVFDVLEPYKDSVDYFLFDTKTAQHGGSGKTFNWDILQKYSLNVPFFLSGGLSMDNLAEVQELKHPMFYGVDLNSRFETAPGIKNIELLTKAFNLLKQA